MSYSKENKALSEIISKDHLGDIFAHYTGGETILSILHTSELWLNPIGNMDDPHESDRGYLNVSKSNIVEDDLDIILKHNERLLKTSCKILCGVTKKYKTDEKHPALSKRAYFQKTSFGNIYSWIVHSKNFKGGCLVFDKRKLRSDFRAQNTSVRSRKIKYVRDLELEKYIIEDPNYRENGVLESFYRKNYLQVFFKKHYGWKHESEYRFMIFDSTSSSKEILKFYDSLIGVFIGFKMEIGVKRSIKELCERKGIKCFEVAYESDFSDYFPRLVN